MNVSKAPLAAAPKDSVLIFISVMVILID
jgi:hypothetical protein